ncbi:MAG: hypothetical protein ACOYXC_02795, partial [Candidatus Rifleibacteriota bacterium]
ARYAFLVNTMLPHSVPFVHSGQELGETIPVNTGLDFSNQDLEKLKGKKLALFDLCGYNWDGTHAMFPFIKKVIALRHAHSDVVSLSGRDSFATALTGQTDVICFLRRGAGKHLAVVFNRDLEHKLKGELELEWALPKEAKKVRNLLAEAGQKSEYEVLDGRIPYDLGPGECALLIW